MVKHGDDFLNKIHTDVLAEAAKNRFKFKVSKSIVENKNDLRGEIESQNNTSMVNLSYDNLNEDTVVEILNDKTKCIQFNCRINDQDYLLYLVKNQILVYYRVGNPLDKRLYKITSNVEILSNKKFLGTNKFSGLVVFRSIVNDSEDDKLEIYLKDEDSYNVLIEKMKTN